MATTIQLQKHHSLEELQNHMKKCVDQLQKNRLKVIILITKGKTRTEIANDFQVNIDSITDWIKKYNKDGLSGLKTNKGGRKEGNPKWSTEIFDALLKEIDKQEEYWSIPKMIEWIEKRFKKEIPEQTIWYQLDKRGYSYKSSRPHPYLGNREKQESFKKRAWVKS